MHREHFPNNRYSYIIFISVEPLSYSYDSTKFQDADHRMKETSGKQELGAAHGKMVFEVEGKARLTLCKEVKTVSQEKEALEKVSKA